MIGAEDLQAHWRRLWIRAPGFEDGETRVHWMQCGALFADLRVPMQRPLPEGAQCLADLDAGALGPVLAAEGFAGTITLEDRLCTWTRAVNWHGRPEAVDAGILAFDAAGDLIEDGAHAEYRELWRREADRPVTARRLAAGGLEGVLVLSETRFLLGLGVPGAAPSAPRRAALARGEMPEDLPAQFHGFHAYGSWDGTQGLVALCTDPFCEGRATLRRAAGDALIWQGQDFFGKPRALMLETAG